MVMMRSLLNSTRFPTRSFFASSTDHTLLLKTANVHTLPPCQNGIHQYVLAPDGMDLKTVMAVPKLQLARLFRNGRTIYGAKVVNRTLGSLDSVCPRLVEAAKAHVPSGLVAKSTLYGLADYAAFQGVNTEEYDKAVWERIATQFVQEGKGEEANLYLKLGATIQGIQHHEDASEFKKESGGAMAVFCF